MATKERWIAIAGDVEGKSAKECFARFKSIVAKLKAGQQWCLSKITKQKKLINPDDENKHLSI